MRLFSICGPTGSAETVTVVVVTLRPGIGARPVVTDRLASRDRPTPTPAQALELCTHIGQAHGRWSCTARGSPTPVPISNACTQLSRLWASARTGADVEARLPPLRRRWTYVHTLDKRTSVGVARPADLQRPYRSPTRVPNSHACGQTRRPAVALSHAIAPFQSTPRDQHFTHHMPLRLSRCPRAEQVMLTGFGFRTFLSRDLPRPGSFGLQTNQLRRPTQPQVSGHHLFAPADDRQVGE